MPSFTLTNMAKADLKEIGHYTLKNGGENSAIIIYQYWMPVFISLPLIRLKARIAAKFVAATENLMQPAMLFFTDKISQIQSRLYVSCMDVWTLKRGFLCWKIPKLLPVCFKIRRVLSKA